jgi:hypothetical protein
VFTVHFKTVFYFYPMSPKLIITYKGKIYKYMKVKVVILLENSFNIILKQILIIYQSVVFLEQLRNKINKDAIINNFKNTTCFGNVQT